MALSAAAAVSSMLRHALLPPSNAAFLTALSGFSMSDLLCEMGSVLTVPSGYVISNSSFPDIVS